MKDERPPKIFLSDEEWKARLTPEQYRILREKGTEYPCSGEFYTNKEQGTYFCAACGLPLFRSSSKFDSGTGWPSFFEPLSSNNLLYREDLSHNMQRVEVSCAACESHLGHVFADGPPPFGHRFCINSMALKFVKG
jgi:peptide-methionine (R)-S-oxide reductase